MCSIVFLVDTSECMKEKASPPSGHLTLLDVIKKAIQMFIRKRLQLSDSIFDTYMLFTMENPPNNYKAEAKGNRSENLQSFYNTLNSLECNSSNSIGVSLKNVYDTLNLIRMCDGVDTFGRGRYPCALQAASIILITVGSKITSSDGEELDLIIPTEPLVPGSCFTKGPHRWDQRLFSFILRLANTSEAEINSFQPDANNIENLCKSTGGRSFCITSHNTLRMCMNHMVSIAQEGFVCRMGNEPNTDNLVFLVRAPDQKLKPGIWPIPEAFRVNSATVFLPQREIHPVILFNAVDKPKVMKYFPVDEYIFEESSFTKLMLSKEEKNSYWNVTIKKTNSIYEVVDPFGFIEADKTENILKLNLLCYNYPVLLQIVKSLIEIYNKSPTLLWKNTFHAFLRTVPPYYMRPIRLCLRTLLIHESTLQLVFPKNTDLLLMHTILRRLQSERDQAKIMFEKLYKKTNDVCEQASTSGINEPQSEDTLPCQSSATDRKTKKEDEETL